MTTRAAWDYILKFIIIGDASVGKSSLLVRLTEGRFMVDTDATIGIEFGSHILTLDSGERLKLQVWDTAGSEQFRSGAAGCLLVYDVTERDTFEHLPSWLYDVREQCEEGATIALVGNMSDRPATQRRVSVDEAAEFAAANDLLFFETSAKTGANVEAVFKAVAKAIIAQYAANPEAREQGTPGVSLATDTRDTAICCTVS
ncbi:hypothetical protein MSPP1_003120 [Malassezia sp. CBS 17886]|nr:hypothetical protein MSPP1_003120 [Malassezia sp. CBS 17886]